MFFSDNIDPEKLFIISSRSGWKFKYVRIFSEYTDIWFNYILIKEYSGLSMAVQIFYGLH